MNSYPEVQPYLEQAIAEHREVHRAVESLKRRLDRPVAEASAEEFAAAVQQTRRLREMLFAHFAREEEGGYLDEAVSRAPYIAPQAARLQRQHGQFVALADRILDRADSAESWEAGWRLLRHDYVRLAKRLDAHEAAEDRILGRAFNVAVG